MAQTSIGFNGSISAVQWAQGAALLLSNGYGVGSVTECAVTQVAGQRAVSVAAGRIGGDGVVTTLSSAETVALPTPTNGQWYLLVLNRKWSDGSTSLLVRNGPTTAAAASGAVPSSYPASVTVNPGVNSDIPVAWLWATSGSTSVVVVPLLRTPAAVYPRRGTAAARDALYGTPSVQAAQWALQGREWFNTDTACTEAYFGPYDATVNPTGVPAAGWFPVAGAFPEGYIGRGTQSAVPANNTIISPDTTFTWANGSRVVTGGMLLDAKGQAYTVPYDGEYELESQIVWARTSAGGARTSWWVRNPTDPNVTSVSDISNNTVAYSQVNPVSGDLTSVLTRKRVTLNKGDRVVLWIRQSAGGDLAIDPATTAQNRAGCYTAVRYVGPLAGRSALTV